MASKSTKANSSRIPNFFKLDIDDRIRALYERGLLTDSDLHNLLNGEHTLKRHVADKMIENVIGVLGLPLGLGLNFLVNGKDYVYHCPSKNHLSWLDYQAPLEQPDCPEALNRVQANPSSSVKYKSSIWTTPNSEKRSSSIIRKLF